MQKIKYLNKMFVLTILLFGCKPDNLKKHLEKLHELNSQIDLNGWQIIQKIEYESDFKDYVLEKQVKDTSFILCFTYSKENGNSFYSIQEYKKSYLINGFYYEMALFNSDTLYFFKYKKITKIKEECFTNIKMLDFTVGKYYYIYKNGKLNSGQMNYFEIHKDSLIKIRGNDLLDLPDLRSQKEKKDTIISIIDD